MRITEGFFGNGTTIKKSGKVLDIAKHVEKLRQILTREIPGQIYDEDWPLIDSYLDGCVHVSNLGELRREIRRFGNNKPLNWIDVSGVTDMHALFEWDDDLEQGDPADGHDISRWDVSNVKDMSRMFFKNYHFNGDISGWDTSSVTDMHDMFACCYSFNQDLDKWNTASVTDMNYMFDMCELFNGDISGWDVSKVCDMSNMFDCCYKFNCDISGWDVSNVKTMFNMFYGCRSFNIDISGWDVSSVTDARQMFRDCKSFDQDLSTWPKGAFNTFLDHTFDGTLMQHKYNQHPSAKLAEKKIQPIW